MSSVSNFPVNGEIKAEEKWEFRVKKEREALLTSLSTVLWFWIIFQWFNKFGNLLVGQFVIGKLSVEVFVITY